MAEVWKQAAPLVQDQVSGRGVWAALGAAKAVALEDNVLVLGLAPQDAELAGHLRIPSTLRIAEMVVSKILGAQTRVRVIDGTTQADYDIVKRRDIERRRLQEAEMAKMRTEVAARTTWDSVYEQLSRRFAAVSNKSLPQNKARFFDEAVELITKARQEQGTYDEMGERNFARCLERAAQYCEIPSTLFALHVLQRLGEI